MKGLSRATRPPNHYTIKSNSSKRYYHGPPPVLKPLIDTFDRQHTYLRISLTERCNLRCNYCMPPTSLPSFSPSSSMLTTPEILRLATLFVQQGVNKIRLTGGEPTIRKDIVPLVHELSSRLRPLGLKTLAMTSNGVVLRRKLADLVHGGLTHLNLSLDTLNPETFTQISHRPSTMHAAALSTLQMALSLSPALKSLKLNTVVMADTNLQEIPAFAALTRAHHLTVRFIEYMPFQGTRWKSNQMVPSRKVLDILRETYPGISPALDDQATSSDSLGSDHSTAKEYRIPGYKGSIGFISSMSDHFCASCTRLRITADGQLKVCLFDPKEVSLRDMLRSGDGGASDEKLLEVISAAVKRKKASHGGMDLLDRNKGANRSMIRIGLQAKRRSPNLPLYGSWITYGVETARWHSSIAPNPPNIKNLSPLDSKDGQLSHIDPQGRPHMVDVSSKEITARSATARGAIRLNDIAFSLLVDVQGDYSDARNRKERDEREDNHHGADMPVHLLVKARHKSGTPSNVLTVAQLAGIMAAKSTSSLIPLCHPLPLTHISVNLRVLEEQKTVECMATVQCDGKTGVEMEALTAVSVALLTVWDMLKKAGGKEMMIEGIKVVEKSGGQSGDFTRTD